MASQPTGDEGRLQEGQASSSSCPPAGLWMAPGAVPSEEPALSGATLDPLPLLDDQNAPLPQKMRGRETIPEGPFPLRRSTSWMGRALSGRHPAATGVLRYREDTAPLGIWGGPQRCRWVGGCVAGGSERLLKRFEWWQTKQGFPAWDWWGKL